LRVAPFVVIPRDNLQHVVTHDHGERGVDRRGDVRASEVAGHERLVSDSQDALELAVGSLAEGGVDFVGGDLLGGLDDQIDDGDVRRRHAERDTVELTLELREHERDSLGGTGGGRHNVQGSGTSTAQVTVGRIEDALVTSVRVGGGHQTLDETKLFVEHLDERRETVGGAGRVGNDLVGVLVLVSVDTEHVGRDVVTLGRGGDHNLLGTRGEVLGGARGVDEDAGTFNDNVDTESRPRELERVTGGNNFDHLAVDGDVGVVDNLDIGFKGAEDRVVLDQVGGLLDSARVVDGDNVEHRVGASVPAAQEVAANAAETVDGNLAGLALHGGNGLGASRLGGGLALDATGEGLFRLGRESRGCEARERLRSRRRGVINERSVSTSKRFVRVLVLVLVKPRLFFRRSVEPRSRVGKYTLTSHDSSNGIMVDWKSKKKKSTRRRPRADEGLTCARGRTQPDPTRGWARAFAVPAVPRRRRPRTTPGENGRREISPIRIQRDDATTRLRRPDRSPIDRSRTDRGPIASSSPAKPRARGGSSRRRTTDGTRARRRDRPPFPRRRRGVKR